MNIRIYVTLMNGESREGDMKKLIVMTEGNMRISMLKRRIEQEYSELFPREKPLIVSKIEDQHGYSLSNNSFVSDLLKTDDRIFALPETQTSGFVSGTDISELLSMLSNMQENISGKLLECGLNTTTIPRLLLFNIIPLCFVNNLNTMHNACKCLGSTIHEGNFRIFDETENSDLLTLLVNGLHYLVFEYMEHDTVVQRTLVDLLEVLIRSRGFLAKFRSNSVSQKLVSSSKSMNSNYKAKIIRIISSINRGEDNWQDVDTGFKERPAPASRDQKKPPDSSKSQDRYKPGTRDYKTSLTDTGMGSMLSDFIQMLSVQNTSEMICFALHSLENFVSEAIDIAVQDPELFMKCFNLVEISTPSNFHAIQSKLISCLANKLNQARAEELVSKNGITRLLKAFINADSYVQAAILQLFEQSLKIGRKKIDVPSLISISVCANSSVNVLGIEALAAISDPAEGNFSDEQFENHIRFFINACINDKQSDRFRNAAAACVANLSLREYLKPQIIYCGGIDSLLFMVKDQNRVEGQRLAAKALVNLTSTKRDLKMKVVAELSDEIRKLYRNELDSIVSTYLQALVSSRS